MIKKIISFCILTCITGIPLITHAFGDPFIEKDDPPFQRTNVTKAIACNLPDGSYSNRDSSLTDIKRPLASGERLENPGGFYKYKNNLYYGINLIDATNNRLKDGGIFSYDCNEFKGKELINTSQFRNENYKPEIHIIKATNDYIELRVVSDGMGYLGTPTSQILNLQTLSYDSLNLTIENIANLDNLILTYKPIIEEYKNLYVNKYLMSEQVGGYDKFDYPSISMDDNANMVYNKLQEMGTLLLPAPIKIHDIDDNGNGYLSLQISFYVCSHSTTEECQDEKNLTSTRLPMITAPINILTRTIDTSKIYKSIDLDEVTWLYTNGLTKYNDLNTFNPWTSFTREQAAKFFSQYATKVKKMTPNLTSSCEFNDIESADSTLKQDIITSCQLGIFKGSKGYFDPKRPISHEEAATVLVRIIFGIQDESMKPRYTKYVAMAKTNGLIVNDGISFDIGNPIERGEVGQMLYNAKNK